MLSLRSSVYQAAVRRPFLAAFYSDNAQNTFDGLLSDLAPTSHPPTAPPPDLYSPGQRPTARSTEYKPFAKGKTTKPRYHLHVFSSRNNTIATFTRGNGQVIAWCSG